MLRRVQKYIHDHNLLSQDSRVLVCVSGGADSVALLDVLLRSGYECIVAHCNFHLRGQESIRDEQFVTQLTQTLPQRLRVCPDWAKQGLPLYTTHYDTCAYAREHNMSIETAARTLRYQWFRDLAVEQQCQAIAVAHHQNDQAETVMMHIRRGCGLNGLCGMWPKSANPMGGMVPVVRPLLCTTHDYICHYLRDIRHIDWVEDSTNSDTTYRRNAIRQELAAWTKAEIVHVAELAERMQKSKIESQQ